MSTAFAIGNRGEKRVHEILEDSIFVNGEKQAALAYDILWKGIKIDVKTTENYLSKNYVQLGGVRGNIRHNGIVLVLVAFQNDKEYFWVDQYSENTKTSRLFSDSIKADELASAILAEVSRNVTPITKDRPLVYKSMTVPSMTHTKLNEIGTMLKAEQPDRARDVSIPEVLDVLIAFYQQRRKFEVKQ